MKCCIKELEEQWKEFELIEQELNEKRAMYKRKNREAHKQKMERFCTTKLNSYVTVTENGIPTIHDLDYVSHTFNSVKEAYDFYEIVSEASPSDMNYLLLKIQLRSYLVKFKDCFKYGKELLNTKTIH